METLVKSSTVARISFQVLLTVTRHTQNSSSNGWSWLNSIGWYDVPCSVGTSPICKLNESYITNISRRLEFIYYLEDFAEQFSQFNDRPGERTLVVVSSTGILQHKTRVAIHLIAGKVHHGVQCKSTRRNLT
jgi:hypothetical protein